MGFLDKVKNMFIEEIEEDEPVKQEVVKKVEPVEKPVVPVMPEIEEEPVEQVITEKREEKFVFPVYFDDKDFEELERKEEVKPRPKPVEAPPIRETYAYGVKKEEKVEKKNFKPTPIISPVYGILDKNYRKEEIKTRKIVSSYEYGRNEKVDIDDVRKKAYGTLEDDLEDNLFQKTSILFSDEVEKQEQNNDTIDIFEEVELQRSKDIDDDDYLDDFEFDDTDNMIEEALNRDYTEEEDSSYINELNDSDLFNLIDSMYERGENE